MKHRYIGTRVYIFILCLLSSQIVFFSVHNPISVTLTREIFILMCGFGLFTYFVKQNLFLQKIDLIWLGLMFGAALLSSVCAYIAFGQPLQYGLIENRRIFEGLLYFPLVMAIRRGRIDEAVVIRYVMVSTIICMLVGLIVDQLGGAQNSQAYNANDLRADRLGIGLHFVALGFIYMAYVVRERKATIKQIIYLGACPIYLLLIGQSRQVVIASLFIAMLLYKGRLKAYFWFLFVMFSVFSAIMLNDDLLARVMQSKTIQMFSDSRYTDNFDETVRGLAIGVVLKELPDKCFYGCGALSSLFNNGFGAVYGDYFYLSDIGVFGILYQYGIYSVLPLGVMCYLLWQAHRSVRYDRTLGFVSYWILYLIILLPTAAPLEFRSAFLGLIFALAFARPLAVRIQDRKNDDSIQLKMNRATTSGSITSQW